MWQVSRHVQKSLVLQITHAFLFMRTVKIHSASNILILCCNFSLKYNLVPRAFCPFPICEDVFISIEERQNALGTGLPQHITEATSSPGLLAFFICGTAVDRHFFTAHAHTGKFSFPRKIFLGGNAALLLRF